MLQILLIAARNLVQHARRTLLLGFVIAAVTAFLVLLVGLFDGIEKSTIESATTLMSGHLNVGGFFKASAGQSAPVLTHAHKLLEDVRKDVPEIDYVTERVRGWAKLVTETGSLQAGVAGIDIQNEPGLKRILKIDQGSFDGLNEPHTVLMFQNQAEKLGVKLGDVVTISAQTTRGVNNTADVRVVAIANDVGILSAFNTFVPAQTLRELYQEQDDTTGALLVYLKNIDDAGPVSERLRKTLAAQGYTLMDPDPRAFFFKFDSVNREAWTGQKLDITSWKDELSFILWLSTAMHALGYLLVSVLIVVIAVGLMNTLWVAIRERTREIGTLRSIGMQRPRVMAMFVTEAFLLSFGATVGGALFGLLVALFINGRHVRIPFSMQAITMSDHLTLLPSATSVSTSVAIIVACTTAVSLIPSFLAARLKPVSAMSQVD